MRCRSATGRPWSTRPNSTLPATVSQGNRTYSWKTTPRSAPGPTTGLPSTRTVPALGVRKPATMLRSVDLPQPDGPRMHTNSRSATSRSMSTRAGDVWQSAANDLLTRWIWILGPPGISASARVLPPQQPALEQPPQRVARVAEQSQHAGRPEHLGDQEEVSPVVDEIAQPLLGSDELRDDDDEERQGDSQPEPGQD